MGEKALAVLIDPDIYPSEDFDRLLGHIGRYTPDLILVGGSLLSRYTLNECISEIKGKVDVPVVLFPGEAIQVDETADALFFLSLISGRNPEYLVGQQVRAAPLLKKAGLETIPTGYMLVDGGHITTAHYMSHTIPIPSDKVEIAVNTALAGGMLGLECLFLDAGSGAEQPIPEQMITAVRANVDMPLIVGGGMKSPEQVARAVRAGADIVVVGNVLQSTPDLLQNLHMAVHRTGKGSKP